MDGGDKYLWFVPYQEQQQSGNFLEVQNLESTPRHTESFWEYGPRRWFSSLLSLRSTGLKLWLSTLIVC